VVMQTEIIIFLVVSWACFTSQQLSLRLTDRTRALFNGGLLCTGSAQGPWVFNEWNVPVEHSIFDVCTGTLKISATVAPTNCPDGVCDWILKAQVNNNDRCQTGDCVISPWGTPPTIECQTLCTYQSLGTYTMEHHILISAASKSNETLHFMAQHKYVVDQQHEVVNSNK